MTTTVHVSRTFTVDPSDPKVLDELRTLASRGFEVLGPLNLTPVSSVPAAPGGGERKNRAVALLKELKSRGVSAYSAASLIGVAPRTLYGWVGGHKRRREIPERRIGQLESLLKRSQSLPEGSTRLLDEARGARRARRLQTKKRTPSQARTGLGRGRPRALSEEQRLDAAVRREAGETLKSLASLFGCSVHTVARSIREVGL